MATQDSSMLSSSLSSVSRLQKIDRLRELDVSSDIPLPQLVVVGYQSSGKSALLETLTGIPFPRSVSRCTRYATQISQYRQDVDIIRVSIIPIGRKEGSMERKKLQDYKKELNSVSDLHSQFQSILREVDELMGISTEKNAQGSKSFCRDILKIEKRGPAEDNLTVIDVPGLFQVTGTYTTDADMNLVQAMAEDYLRNDRTIVLAVVSCEADPDNELVLKLARQHDPDGKRTLGILTKPDLIREKARQQALRRLIEMKDANESAYLSLGYYIVVNRGADDSGPDKANVQKREQIFKEEPWCSLPKGRVGIAALKSRLQDLLGHLTDREFPALRAEARCNLAAAKKELATLGSSRGTERQQQQYLASMATKFQDLVRAASVADYSSDKAFDEHDDLRLITAVVNETDRFSSEFLRLSHTHHFQTSHSFDSDTESDVEDESSSEDEGDKRTEEDEAESGDEDDEDHKKDGENSCEDEAMRKARPGTIANHLQEADVSKFPELSDIVNTDWEPSVPNGDIMIWIERMYRRSRGVELGTFGPGLLASAFREQSKKWEPITRLYLSRIIYIIHGFIIKALREVCADEAVFTELQSSIMDEILTRYKHSMDQVEFLTAVERAKRPFTLNDYFSSHLQKLRIRRLTTHIRHEATKNKDKKWVVQLDAVESAVNNKSNQEQAKEDVHDILEAYYKVARERFVDNVYQQVVDYDLLTKENSPLHVFSEAWVLNLDTERLATIARETPVTRDRRDLLEGQIKSYEDALRVLR